MKRMHGPICNGPSLRPQEKNDASQKILDCESNSNSLKESTSFQWRAFGRKWNDASQKILDCESNSNSLKESTSFQRRAFGRKRCSSTS